MTINDSREINISFLPDKKHRSDEQDIFKTPVDEISGYGRNARRRIKNRIDKRLEGENGAKSKQISDEYTAYDAFDVAIPPYNLEYLSKLYEVSPYNYAAINAKVANVVGLGYEFVETFATKQLLEKTKSENKKRIMRQKLEVMKNDMEQLVDRLNDEQLFIESISRAYIDYQAMGVGYIEIGRSANGRIGYVGNIPATTVRVRKDRDGFVQIVGRKAVFFRNFGDTETADPIGSQSQPNEIIQLRNYSPGNSYYGTPDIVSAMPAVAGNEFATRYNLDYFEHRASPRYIITLKGAKLSKESESRLLEFMQSSLKGKNHRSLYIPLPADDMNSKTEFKMEPVESGVQDSSFDKYRTANRDEILMAHRVPITKIGISDNASVALAKDADKTFKEQVCLAGETLVMTPGGDIPIKELAGGDAVLLVKDMDAEYSSAKWVTAPIKSFGEQRLYKITISRNGMTKEIYATAAHRWFVKKTKRHNVEVTTETLSENAILTPIRHRSSASKIVNYEYGIPHGVVYGDGHINSNGSAGVSLFGAKDAELLKYFPYGMQGTYHTEREEGFYTTITGMPQSFKSLPSLKESTGYLYGFLAGWFAADGHVRKNGSASLDSTNLEALEHAKLIARKVGINTYPIIKTISGGNTVNGNYLESRNSYRLTFFGGDLADSFFLIEKHRERWAARTSDREMEGWKVESVEVTERVEEVFCAVVDGIGNFALADNILTGNCQPEQKTLGKKLNRIISEFTDAVELQFNELTLTDEDTQSRIDERYLRMQVIVPNEVRARKGLPALPGGDKVIDMTPQGKAEQTAQADGNRKRDQERQANNPDSSGSQPRNPKGEGRQQA